MVNGCVNEVGVARRGAWSRGAVSQGALPTIEEKGGVVTKGRGQGACKQSGRGLKGAWPQRVEVKGVGLKWVWPERGVVTKGRGQGGVHEVGVARREKGACLTRKGPPQWAQATRTPPGGGSGLGAPVCTGPRLMILLLGGTGLYWGILGGAGGPPQCSRFGSQCSQFGPMTSPSAPSITQ